MKQKRVVCIGGGTGLSTLLRGLKKYCTPTAVVTMADSGGHSGQLRDELGVLPPGDIRSCLVALANDEKTPILRDLFNYRFLNGSYSGASVGNLLLAALNDILGDFDKAVTAAHDLLGLKGKVVPVTTESTDLLAELVDGTILFGEKAIDLPRKNGHVQIKRVWLQPQVNANKVASKALERADAIMFGPGDLYTSILPNLYVQGIREAIGQSNGKIIFITNIMTKHGETDGFSVENFTQVLEEHLPRPVDFVVYNTQPVPQPLLKSYEQERANQVIAVQPKPHWHGAEVLSTAGDLARHDSEKLAAVLNQLISNW